MSTDRGIDAYIAGFPDWRGVLLARLRQLVDEASVGASSSVRWAQPVWESNGPMVWMKAHAAHVNLGFWRGIDLRDDFALLLGDGDRMRHLSLRQGDPIPEEPIRDLVRQAVALNLAKGDPTRRR